MGLAMEYGIINEMAALVLAGLPVREFLSGAAELLCKAGRFDQCCVYTLDESGQALSLSSCCGSGPEPPVSYGLDEGMAGLAAKGKAPMDIHTDGSSAWQGVEDPGLAGFRRVNVFELRDASTLFGVVYLKSARETEPLEGRGRALEGLALLMSAGLKLADLTERYRTAFDELKKIQAKLANTEKLLSLGDMAATLAHEIKNPLLSIGGFATRIKKHLEPDSPGHPYVEQMLNEIRRVEKVMDGVVRFQRDNAVELYCEDANSIIDEALVIFEDETRAHDIDVARDFVDAPLLVLVDREQIKIAFENLIANAIQSMEGGGTLKVSTRMDAGSVVAEIADTGVGIDEKEMEKIFNPFFTTKKHGTGLGLPISNSIILLHQGSIQVKNNQDRGATFTVRLPQAPKKA